MDEEIYIPSNYDVHHIVSVKEGGTNALINLQLVTRPEHTRIHMKKELNGRICKICGSIDTYTNKKTGYVGWLGNEKDGFICMKCYKKRKYYKKKNK